MVNLQKLREKQKELSGEKTGENTNYLNIKPGMTQVRILPSKDEEDPFYVENRLHYMTGADGKNTAKHCLRIQGEKCPLCEAFFAIHSVKKELREQMIEEGKIKKDAVDDKVPELKALREKAKSIAGTDRFYMNVLDRESGEVKIWSTSHTVFTEIVDVILRQEDPENEESPLEYPDFLDVEKGFDYKIKQSKGPKDRYPSYKGSGPRRQSSKLGTKKERAEYMDSLHDLKEIVKKEDYDELRKIAISVWPAITEEERPEAGEEEEKEAATSKDFADRMES